jgi:hypothetical protein
MTTRRLLWQRNINKEELLSPRNVNKLLRVRNDNEVTVTKYCQQGGVTEPT